MAYTKSFDDDEYVAKLLAEDAKKTSLRYAQQGLSALLPRRPMASAPKPNTRFLKAIVREADTHNVALKKKEELEARIRQRKLSERNRREPTEDDYDNERPRKRRRDEEHHRRARHSRDDISHGRLNTSPEGSTSRERRHKKDRRVHDGERVDGRRNDKRSHIRKRHRSRSCSETRSADRQDRKKISQMERLNETEYKRRRHESRSVLSAGSKEQQKPDRIRRDRSKTRRPVTPERDESEDDRQNEPDAYESDPLEMLVGPLERLKRTPVPTEKPPVRSKGRGAYRTSGAVMDAHFSSDYNPGLDLHPESEPEDEKEDWDMALEALRDREMFKRKHAERLREAGFDDAEVKKWEDSGKEKDIADVKWAARGEAREWDLGKGDQD